VNFAAACWKTWRCGNQREARRDDPDEPHPADNLLQSLRLLGLHRAVLRYLIPRLRCRQTRPQRVRDGATWPSPLRWRPQRYGRQSNDPIAERRSQLPHPRSCERRTVLRTRRPTRSARWQQFAHWYCSVAALRRRRACRSTDCRRSREPALRGTRPKLLRELIFIARQA
jgi:hypothetical protein